MVPQRLICNEDVIKYLLSFDESISSMSSDIISVILFDKTFAVILYRVEIRVTGLRSYVQLAPLFLGQAIMIELSPRAILPEEDQ